MPSALGSPEQRTPLRAQGRDEGKSDVPDRERGGGGGSERAGREKGVRREPPQCSDTKPMNSIVPALSPRRRGSPS